VQDTYETLDTGYRVLNTVYTGYRALYAGYRVQGEEGPVGGNAVVADVLLVLEGQRLAQVLGTG
jgi:hypothetical protein